MKDSDSFDVSSILAGQTSNVQTLSGESDKSVEFAYIELNKTAYFSVLNNKSLNLRS